MAFKFLDFETGLPHLWKQILSRLETHNTSTIAHQDIRDTISSLTSSVENKVDKETGKVLSSNDYTSAEKTKLAGIATGATKVTVDSSLSSSSTNPVQNKIINAALEKKASTATTDTLQSSINTLNTKVATTATSSALGMMSAADKAKLDGIATGATKTTIDTALSSSSTNPVQNKVIYAALADKATIANVSTVSDNLSAFMTQKGAASGIVPLNSSSKIDSTYLPSYVDDVLEYTSKSNFPSTGETGKIYVDTSTNLTWRWGGSAYVEISPSIALGTTSSTAFRGDYGNTAYTHAVTNKGKAFSSGFYKITTNSEGHITAVSAVAKSDITALGIPAQDTTYTSLKNPYSLSINGKSYDGSAAVNVGILGVTYGGTGATTQSGAFTNIVAPGGTTTGPITAKGSMYIANNTDNAFLSFIPTNFGTNTMGKIYYYAVPSKTNSYFEFHQFSRSSSDYSRLAYTDVFQLPTADADKTAYSYHKIITTKNLADADGRWLKKSGDTMTGNLSLQDRNLYFTNYSNETAAELFYMTTSTAYSNFRFRQYSKTSSSDATPLSTFEEYQLPNVNYDRTDNKYYTIATNKNPELLDGRWLNLSGGTLTGAITFKSDLTVKNSTQYPCINFSPSYGNGIYPGQIYFRTGTTTTGLDAPRFLFRQWSPKSSGSTELTSCYEDYYLPPTENAKTSNGFYCIYTDKETSQIFNDLPTGDSIPQDADYYICQYAGGGTTTTTYYRRPTSALWTYVNGKLGTSAVGSSSQPIYWNGSKPVACGAIGAAYGGTGCTSLNASANALINSLGTETATPQDADYFISQNIGGGTTNTDYYRRPISSLWNYINSKAGSVYLKLTGGTLTGQVYCNGNLIPQAELYIQNSTSRPSIKFCPKESGATQMEVVYEGGTDHNNFRVRVYSKKSGTVNRTDGGYYEEYMLPDSTADRTSSSYYNILTDKKTVAVSQGGTGATSAAGARTNLGIYGTIVKSNQDANGNTVSLSSEETFPANMQYTFTAAGTYLIFASASISKSKTGVRAMRFYFYNSSGTNTKKMGEVRTVANNTTEYTIGLNSAIAVTVSANDVVKTLIYTSQTGLKLESYDFTVVRLL